MVYVINVVTGKEFEVTQRIENLNHENIKAVYNPLSIFNTPIFPSYIFVDLEFNIEIYCVIRNIPGVIYFLDPNSEPLPISPYEEATVKDRSSVTPLIGRSVEIVSGTYKGAKGTIKEIKYPYITVQAENFNSLDSSPDLKIHIKHVLLIETTLEPGTKVSITKGDYEGLEGVVEYMMYPNATLSVNILNSEVLLDIPVSNIERRGSNGYG